MSRPVEDPITKPSTSVWRDGTETTHPAFAQIGVSRVQGSTNLYGSDFRHKDFMVIRVKRSQLMRNLNRDWHFGGEEVIEVALSESQWATFVSSPNVGDGVPCTLLALNGKPVSGLPDPSSRTDQFSKEMAKKLENSVKKAQSTIAAVDELGLSKKKAEALKENLNRLLTDLRADLPFVAEQFEEHMEDTVEAAKVEIHGYMTGTIQRAGLAALTKDNMPLAIEHDEES